MSFREKIVWISLIALLVAYGGYFTALGQDLAHGRPLELSFGRLVFCIVVLVAIETVLTVTAAAVAAIRNPGEATQALDERERLIRLRGRSAGFFMLSGGTVCVAAGGLFDLSAGQIANGVILSLALAEIVRCGTELSLYRTSA